MRQHSEAFGVCVRGLLIGDLDKQLTLMWISSGMLAVAILVCQLVDLAAREAAF